MQSINLPDCKLHLLHIYSSITLTDSSCQINAAKYTKTPWGITVTHKIFNKNLKMFVYCLRVWDKSDFKYLS